MLDNFLAFVVLFSALFTFTQGNLNVLALPGV